MELSLELNQLYPKFKELNIESKYLPYTKLSEHLRNREEDIEQIGSSFLDKPIHQITIGKGEKKVLIWSQMHGNESTGTRAMLDVLNFLQTNHSVAGRILNELTIHFIPMLNPDGSNKYTRRNVVGIDINRDFVKEASVEMQLLKKIANQEDYEFLFNLHDQRTIFNVGDTNEPATLSFLAASGDKERTINETRKEVMGLIQGMNKSLQMLIKGKIGRYSDEYYPTACGDNFTKLNKRCVLFEAGHFPNDYDRNQTRKYNAIAIILGLNYICKTYDYTSGYEGYFDIPENGKRFLDMIFRNVRVTSQSNQSNLDIGVYFRDELIDGKLTRVAEVTEIGDLSNLIGHKEMDMKNQEFKTGNNQNQYPKLGKIQKFTIGNLKISQDFFREF